MAADKARLHNYTERSESSFRPSALTGFPVSSKRPHGGVAQLVERFGRIEEARGSIPLTSTQKRKISRGPDGSRAMTFLMAIALVLGACGVSSENKAYSGLELDKPRPMPDPILIDTQGQRFAMRSDTQGSVRLVYFGFTSCPDICPVHLEQLSNVLARPGMPPNVKVLFVTVDPETDTPAVIRNFLNHFSVDFIGLTGTKEQLVDVQRQFSALVALTPNDEEGTPNDLGHDGRVFAFAPDGLGRTQYPHPTRQTTWTRDLPKLAALR